MKIVSVECQDKGQYQDIWRVTLKRWKWFNFVTEIWVSTYNYGVPGVWLREDTKEVADPRTRPALMVAVDLLNTKYENKP